MSVPEILLALMVDAWLVMSFYAIRGLTPYMVTLLNGLLLFSFIMCSRLGRHPVIGQLRRSIRLRPIPMKVGNHGLKSNWHSNTEELSISSNFGYVWLVNPQKSITEFLHYIICAEAKSFHAGVNRSVQRLSKENPFYDRRALFLVKRSMRR